MVLVLAALYTYARYNNHDCLAADYPPFDEDEEQDIDSTDARIRHFQRRLSHSFRHAKDTTQSLVETTVGRCHQSASAAATASTNTAESSTFPLYSSYSLEKPVTSMDTTTTATSTSSGTSQNSILVSPGAAAAAATSSSPPRSPVLEDASLKMFPKHVREEWINAVFGPDYCSTGQNSSSISQAPLLSPQRGVGNAGIASYTSYTTRIPVDGVESEKVGITVSRLPLGLYVRRVAQHSEAALLGVQVGDVLVSINGLCVLAEPSRQLLERIWHYEGATLPRDAASSSLRTVVTRTESSTSSSRRRRSSHQGTSATAAAQESSTATAATEAEDGSSCISSPVSLTLIRQGQLYSILLLSAAPSWGLAWAPCGNFPLVKRAYSLAAKAGVQRGAILASVNGASFRQLDHYGTAQLLSKDFARSKDTGDAIYLTLCFPPSAARPRHVNSSSLNGTESGTNGTATTTTSAATNRSSSYSSSTSSHHHPSSIRRRAPEPKRVLKTDDGVEVKFHSLEFAINGLCNAAGGSFNALSQASPPTHARSEQPSLTDLAEQVAAGAVESPFSKDIVRHLPSSRLFSPCPVLSRHELMEAWNPMDSLLYCLAFYKMGYQEDALQDYMHNSAHDVDSGKSASSTVQSLYALMNTPHAAGMASAFLLQFISVICFPVQEFLVTAETKSEEKKSDDIPEDTVDIAAAASQASKNQDAKDLTSMLLKLSRRDEGFCQRLYFLLRSYISSFETKRPTSAVTTTTTTTTSTTTTSAAVKDGSSSRHLMALLNCLELLRFAEKQLAGHLHHDSSILSLQTRSSSLSVSPSAANVVGNNKAVVQLSPMPNAVPASPASSASMAEQEAAAHVRKKSVLGFLRKKKPSAAKKPGSKLHPSNTSSGFMRSRSNSSSAQPEQYYAPSQEVTLQQSSNELYGAAVPSRSSSLSGSQQQQKQQLVSSIMSDSSLSQSPSVMYENMSDFLSQLDRICSTIERSLQRSFRQKIADWAMQPWSASKDTALASVTGVMRQSLKESNTGNGSDSQRMLLVNPVESSELLSSVDSDECYILPSAHFPILLTFNVSERRSSDSPVGEERIYRTTVKLRGLRGSEMLKSASYTVHAAVAGKIMASDESRSTNAAATKHVWTSGKTLVFETRSSWGAPQTLSLRLSSSSLTNPTGDDPVDDASFGWVDLSQLWEECGHANSGATSVACQLNMLSLEARDEMFDEQGELPEYEQQPQIQANRVELELQVTTECVDFNDATNGDFSRKRMLLYKHDDDLRQEDFAVQFIRTCDNILKASGLDMKLLTFQCIPVGTRRGFVEWVPGSVPLSEVCQPFLDSFLESSDSKTNASDGGRNSPSMFAKAGLTKYESLFRLGGSLQSESFRRLAGAATTASEKRGSFANNPVQDYLRSVAYDETAPFLIRRDVMDTYIKSCAGYSVITYILGVGDRHLDNLLLHQSGSFFHCDYSFILGSDPKKYLPMRITEDMVNGMGGRSSDNYAKFLSLTSAAFLALRRPEIVRVLLSMVRLMECSNLPDLSENQSIDQAVMGMRDRLRLDLREDQAVAFMENLIEDTLNSKLWLAVDAIHSLGKKF